MDSIIIIIIIIIIIGWNYVRIHLYIEIIYYNYVAFDVALC